MIVMGPAVKNSKIEFVKKGERRAHLPIRPCALSIVLWWMCRYAPLFLVFGGASPLFESRTF